MTAELVWADIYETGRTAFGGQTPGRNLEQQLVDLFHENPAAIINAITKLEVRYIKGEIHSPWPLVLREATTETEAAQRRHLHVANAGPQLEHKARLAETWIRNAGAYAPTEQSLLDALFDEHGPLKAWAHDQHLRDRMLAVYRTERPRFEKTEADFKARNAPKTAPTPEPEP